MFLRRHLELLPAHHQDKDPNKLAIIFYSVVGLSILGEDVKMKYKHSIPWLESLYLNDGEFSGFLMGSTKALEHFSTISLPNTLFALLILLQLDDRKFFEQELDRNTLGNFVHSCQREDGSFSSFLNLEKNPAKVDSNDLRFAYIAVSILHIAGCRTEDEYSRYINVKSLVHFVQMNMCSVGGFGKSGEPQGGYTSCALSLLSLLGRLDCLPMEFIDKTIYWLVNRQVSSLGLFKDQDENDDYDPDDIGGLNGRENKLADTCYVFWCLNSFGILEKDWRQLIDTGLICEYLLNQTQNTIIGGFSKNDQDDPDIYHTFLGLAALQLIKGTFNGILCLPNSVTTAYGL